MDDSKDNQNVTCMECEKIIADYDGVETEDGYFCKDCYEGLTQILDGMVQEQQSDINYVNSTMGGILGGVVGGGIWWAITFFTQYAVGIVAIVIGYTVGQGILMLNGGKKSVPIQVLALGLTVASFFYSDYMVTRSFILKEASEKYAQVFTFLPDPAVFFNLLKETFDPMSLIFLGIALWQAWKMTQPVTYK